MTHTNTRIFTISLLLISISLVSCRQSRQDKTAAIMSKLKLVENHKTNYKYQIEPLKYQATGIDSVRIIELEKQLTEDEISQRISKGLDEAFSDEEINDLFTFFQTSAFEKFFNSGETNNIISTQFKEINKEIHEIRTNLTRTIEKPTAKFKPIQVEKKDGFYATVNYSHSTDDKDVKLEENPSLTAKDILEVKKDFSNYNDRMEIDIVFTKKGAQKFYLLTKENIGKPIVIVLGKKIVSMPIVNEEIIGGKAKISGEFSEKEIDQMIEILKK